MKKQTIFSVIIIATAICAITMNGCLSERIAAKGGAQLWGENCTRCHNIPSPTSFNDAQWELAGSHMRMRANLTAEETEKIIKFLKMAN